MPRVRRGQYWRPWAVVFTKHVYLYREGSGKRFQYGHSPLPPLDSCWEDDINGQHHSVCWAYTEPSDA